MRHILEIAKQVYPGVRVHGDWEHGACIAVGEPPLCTYLVLNLHEAARETSPDGLARWMDREVQALLISHRQPTNQMRSWAALLPAVDAATYLSA
jgi:hypothetical protein